jgi:hypothetical protein
MEAQMSIFNLSHSEQETTKKVKDIRTEHQANRKVAYDVGERISHSRKELHALRKAFQESKTQERLREIESSSSVIAAEVITKHELFSSFSLQNEKENGVEPRVAKCKQLIINRIDVTPADDAKSRESYLVASLKLLERLKDCKTWDQIRAFITEMNKQLIYENRDGTYTHNTISKYERMISELKNEPADSTTKQKLNRLSKGLRDAQERLENMRKANEHYFGVLGKRFSSFFTKQASINNSLKTVEKVNSWDDLMNAKKSVAGKKSKPVWERNLPERPDRQGGRQTYVKKPEDLISDFGFRGCQFGNYVEDSVGMAHIFRFSESVMDLADILGVQDSDISLGRLGVAFGARGRGKAAAHFEPANEVINFTKEKGSLGIAAHELAHYFDFNMYQQSHNGRSGKYGYLSDLTNNGPGVPTTLLVAMMDLMTEIKEGSSTAYFLNENTPGTRWTIGSQTKSLYRNCRGDIAKVMKRTKETLQSQMEYSISMLGFYDNKEKAIEKMKKRLSRDLKKRSQALAWYHEQETGERLEKIPYPSDKSHFFQASISLDRGKVNYWASNRELFARCFEAWVEDQLILRNRKSDYLVCGTQDSQAYPVADERIKINKKMDELVNEMVSCLFK